MIDSISAKREGGRTITAAARPPDRVPHAMRLQALLRLVRTDNWVCAFQALSFVRNLVARWAIPGSYAGWRR